MFVVQPSLRWLVRDGSQIPWRAGRSCLVETSAPPDTPSARALVLALLEGLAPECPDGDRIAGRRDVWYRLTPAGADLAPALEELTVWGLRHRRRPRGLAEPVHPEHLLGGLRLVLERSAPPRKKVQWLFDFQDDGQYGLNYDLEHWILIDQPAPPVDLTITTTSGALATFLAAPPAQRASLADSVALGGSLAHREQFTRLVARFPDSIDRAHPRR